MVAVIDETVNVLVFMFSVTFMFPEMSSEYCGEVVLMPMFPEGVAVILGKLDVLMEMPLELST